MSDPLRDPRFPDRPQHPDFWRIIEIVNYLDGEAVEGNKTYEEIVSAIADTNSVDYAGIQRGMLSTRMTSDDPYVQNAGSWIDGFIIGVLFQQRGGHQDA